MDIPRIFNITESAHRIHNPITPEKLATLGAALRLESGARVLDLGSGSGEMLCTWARDHGVIGIGTGIDLSQLFTKEANAVLKNSASLIKSIHPWRCSWLCLGREGQCGSLSRCHLIAGGVAGTIELLAQSLRPRGYSSSASPSGGSCCRRKMLPGGVMRAQFQTFSCFRTSLVFVHLGYDVVEMVLADQTVGTNTEAAKWLTLTQRKNLSEQEISYGKHQLSHYVALVTCCLLTTL